MPAVGDRARDRLLVDLHDPHRPEPGTRCRRAQSCTASASSPQVGLGREPLLPHVGERSPRTRYRVAAAEPGLHLRPRQPRVAQTTVDAPPADATGPVRVLDLVPAR